MCNAPGSRQLGAAAAAAGRCNTATTGGKIWPHLGGALCPPTSASPWNKPEMAHDPYGTRFAGELRSPAPVRLSAAPQQCYA